MGSAPASARDTFVLGADHNGVAAKAVVKKFLREGGFPCIDLGPYEEKPSVDYVDYAKQLGTIIREGDAKWGVLICGTGVGMSIVTNKIAGVRAVLAHNVETAAKSREHNASNVICLGSWINGHEQNLEILRAWLGQEFGEFRHVPRVEKIDPAPKDKIIFANGVFDVLHSGHLQLLKFAKSLGDRLVVGMNSDASVKALKGPTRPMNAQDDRKALLESIRYVDQVVIFEELRPTELVKAINPSIVVKGGEWTADQVRANDDIPEHIEVKVCPIVTGYSSTRLIEHMREM